MSGFSVLLKKEWRENSRNFKVLWIPIAFIIFGILEPVTNHFLPEIMKSVGNMPEGADFQWPEFKGEDIFSSLLGQYQFIGILIIVLAFMGSISGERKNGTATLLYVRPLSYGHYFLSKWLVTNGVVLGSVWLGILAAWYYIEILFNHVDAWEVFAFIATYSIWIVFVVTVVLALSAWLPTGGAAGLAIFATLIFQIIDSLIGTYWTVSPWKVAIYATYWFQPNADMSDLWMSIIITVLFIIVLIIFGSSMAKRNASKTTV
ncbi:ABC transporter permease subunit [Filibacter tadaridae]|uniref:Putative transmembrane protein YxlG n=1 Tax=Filibacter tadaridae TaxID=2483811 RepID=A0A3P5WR36_9BACL|nr:ABC transporter permease subunit [Filibacter tadaridae]VDC21086.1 putative transmembrane protein YxlG [Filibacter tadaridae]